MTKAARKFNAVMAVITLVLGIIAVPYFRVAKKETA